MFKTLLVVGVLLLLAGCETYSVGGTVRPASNVRVSVGIHSGYYDPYPYYYRPNFRYYRPRPVIIHRHVHRSQPSHRTRPNGPTYRRYDERKDHRRSDRRHRN